MLPSRLEESGWCYAICVKGFRRVIIPPWARKPTTQGGLIVNVKRGHCNTYFCDTYINAATMKAGRDYFDLNHSLLQYLHNDEATRFVSGIFMQIHRRGPPVSVAAAVFQRSTNSTASTTMAVRKRVSEVTNLNHKP